MIQFNLTLPLQAINFVVTLYVLKRYLFAPLIERIIERRKEEKQLRDEIILKRRDVENFRAEKTAQLSQFQKDAKVDFPFTPVTNPAAPVKTEEHTVTPPTSQELAALTDELEKRICDGR